MAIYNIYWYNTIKVTFMSLNEIYMVFKRGLCYEKKAEAQPFL